MTSQVFSPICGMSHTIFHAAMRRTDPNPFSSLTKTLDLIISTAIRGKDKIHVKIAQAHTGFRAYLAIIIYVCRLVDIKNDRSADYDY